MSSSTKGLSRVKLTRVYTDSGFSHHPCWICTTRGIQVVAICIVLRLAPKVLSAAESDALAYQTARILRGEDRNNLEEVFGTEGFECKIEPSFGSSPHPGAQIQGKVDLDETDIPILISDDEPDVALLGHRHCPNNHYWKFHRRDLVELALQILQETDLNWPQAETLNP